MNKQLIKDDKGVTVMNLKNLKIICERNEQYDVPELNDSLYLHFKGFDKIQNLEPYYNLCALWLNNNAIELIEGLEKLVNLNCLYLNDNAILKIENLSHLKKLQTLNLSHNRIKFVENLSELSCLTNLNLSYNGLSDFASLSNLIYCKSVQNLDLQSNRIEYDEMILRDILSKMQLTCLYLKGNNLVREFPQYRRQFTVQILTLQFLDDKPVTQAERRINLAWSKSGQQGEIAERRVIEQEKRAEQQKVFLDTCKIQEEVEQKRKEYFEVNQERICKEIREIQQEMDESQNEIVLNRLYKQLDKKENELRELETVANNLTFNKLNPCMCFSSTEDSNGNIIITNKTPEEAAIIMKKYYNPEIIELNRTDKDKRQEQTIGSELQVSDESVEDIVDDVDIDINKLWMEDHSELLENLLIYHRFDFEAVKYEFNKIMRIEDQPVQDMSVEQLQSMWTTIEQNKYRNNKEYCVKLDEID